MTDKIDYSARPDPKDPTQPAPNISTRNQQSGDGKKPSDQLNRDPSQDEDEDSPSPAEQGN